MKLSLVFLHVTITMVYGMSPNINGMFRNTDRLEPDVLNSIVMGAQMAMDECRKQFKWDRWNCPETAFTRRSRMLETKEKAFTDAIVAAGVIYAITRNCSRGELSGCRCNPSPVETKFSADLQSKSLNEMKDLQNHYKDWNWGGCSDDVTYGESILREHMDRDHNAIDAQAFINNHNNQIGRQVIRNSMVRRCKCHGFSGSCGVQTCWMQLVPFEEVVQQLRTKYDKAALITFQRVSGARTVIGNNVDQSMVLKIDHVPNNLLYLEKSPDFCIANNITGWPGTKGRACSRNVSESATVAEKRSCRNLCRFCGYKVKKLRKRVSYACNCKFTWCCEVECDTCVENSEKFYCD